jgi:hypothetical protein
VRKKQEIVGVVWFDVSSVGDSGISRQTTKFGLHTYKQWEISGFQQKDNSWWLKSFFEVVESRGRTTGLGKNTELKEEVRVMEKRRNEKMLESCMTTRG